MKNCNTYVYFALTGDNFDPQMITERIGIRPTESWMTGDKGKYKQRLNYSLWELSTLKGREYLFIGSLVEELISSLYDKIDIINTLKSEFKLNSVLQIVLDVDTNEEQSTPALGFDLKTIEFLFKTGTTIDVDIYRFNSAI